eukprot:8262443-Ditylum_brightwellii.AAC.1
MEQVLLLLVVFVNQRKIVENGFCKIWSGCFDGHMLPVVVEWKYETELWLHAYAQAKSDQDTLPCAVPSKQHTMHPL